MGDYERGDNPPHTDTVSGRFLFLVLVWSFACEEWIIHLGEALAACAAGLGCWPWIPTRAGDWRANLLLQSSPPGREDRIAPPLLVHVQEKTSPLGITY